MNFLRRIRTLFRRRELEAEMAEEMRQHLEQRAADLAADGLPPHEARLSAQRRFGNVSALQEQSRDAFGWVAWERFGKDLRSAARQLVRSPAYALLAILTIALGIGGNTAMFSVLNSSLLRPLPYPQLDELQQIYRSSEAQPRGGLSAADFLALRRAGAEHGAFAAYAFAPVSFAEPGQPPHAGFGARASADLFSVLGVTPQLGRAFVPDEEIAGNDRVVLLSERLWRLRFAQRPDIVGQSIRIDGELHRVVGVLPGSFNEWRHLGAVDLFRPLAFTTAQAGDRSGTGINVIVRSAHPAAGVADFVSAFGAELARQHPATETGVRWRAVSLQSTVADADFRLMLPVLVGLSGFVLLLACSNLANLLLVRTIARAREFAVRGALGASRLQLLRPLVLESLLLSLMGGALAVLLAHGVHTWIEAQIRNEAGDAMTFVLDGRVLAWTLLAAVLTAVAFGLAPALFALRLNLNDTLKSGGRGATGGRGQQRFRQILVVGQIALALVLLAGAAFFLQGLGGRQSRPTGWRAEQVVIGAVQLPTGTYADGEAIRTFQAALLPQLAALPGVSAASLSAATPFFPWGDVRKFIVDGRDRPEAGREPAAMANRVSADYFATYGTALRSGRVFDDRDHATAPPVCLVAESTARTLFGTEEVLGRRLGVLRDGQPEWREIVGVVADVQAADLAANPVVHRLYLPLTQEPPRQFQLAVQSSPASSAALLDGIRATVARLDPDLPVRRLQPASQTVERALGDLRIFRDLLAAFGVLGLGLATLGIYGVISRTTAQRTHEYAIRLVHGADARSLVRLVFAGGIRQALLGSLLGLGGAYGVIQLIAAAFPGLQADRPAILAGTTLVLVAVALLACWLPARRAARIDAVLALRAE
ncbi:MAG: ADOP family duplicated permease [Candidatus Didemnitutus sp.]|nr:ADOP family duplicated permease [Candidatus Didemnitutus sp.]